MMDADAPKPDPMSENVGPSKPTNEGKPYDATPVGTKPQDTSAVATESGQTTTAEGAVEQNAQPVVLHESAPGTAVVEGQETIETDNAEKMKLLEEKIQRMDEEINRLHKENKHLQKLQLDDTWLDGWSTQMFRCTDCNRPFGTQTRLLDHRKTWHSAGSDKIEKYAKAGRNSKPVGIDELKEIFKSGDLILKTTTGDRSIGYVVSSQVLCMTSKVFLKMLGRDSLFKEAMDVRRANVLGFQPAVVTVDDDDKALEFRLQILHHRHDMLPAALVFHELVRIAEICDKYELQLALKPTVDKFLEPHKQNLTGSYYCDWLLVSYVFGYADIFNKISKELILTGSWAGDHLRFEDGVQIYLLSSCTPSSITGKLETLRKEAVEKICQHVKTVQSERNYIWKCKGPANQTECEALVLGHLIKSVNRYHLNNGITWNQSLKSISNQLKGITDLYFPEVPRTKGYSYMHPAHTICSWVPELHRIVNQALESVEGLKLSDFPSSFGNRYGKGA